MRKIEKIVKRNIRLVQENRRIRNVIFTRTSRLIIKKLDATVAKLIDARTKNPKYHLTLLSRDKESKKEEYTFEYRRDLWKVVLEKEKASFYKYTRN